MAEETDEEREKAVVELISKSGDRLDEFVEQTASKGEDWWDYEKFEQMTSQIFFDVNGCFHCGKPGAQLRCSKCKIAAYCDVDCQREDWKDCHKKQRVCKMFCENIDAKVPILLNLAAIGYLTDPALTDFMTTRRNVFFQILARRFNNNEPVISFAVAAVERFGKIRLNGESRMFSSDFKLVSVQFLILDFIDEGEEAERLLRREPSGQLTAQGRERALQALEELARDVHSVGGKISGLTLGKGLTGEAGSDGELARRIRATGCNLMIAPFVGINHYAF